MEKTQSNQLKMFINTKQYLDETPEKWTRVPRIVLYKNDLDRDLIKIGLKNKEANSIMGVKKKKDNLKLIIGLKASAISGPLQAIASEKGDDDLLKVVKLTKSDVHNLAELDVEPKIVGLCTMAREHAEKLPEYGLPEAAVTELETTLDDYTALIGKTRNDRNKKYVVLDEIETLIEGCNKLLKDRMDKVMLVFRDTDEEFYNGYKRARTIVDN